MSKKHAKKKRLEHSMFLHIAETRPPYSEISGHKICNIEYVRTLKTKSEKLQALDFRCFAHLVSKGSNEAGRLYTRNILLCLPEEHHLFDNVGVQGIPEWEFVVGNDTMRGLKDLVRSEINQYTLTYLKNIYNG